MSHFDDQLLDAFAHTFYGYGNYNGAYWFIGIEERGNLFQDVEKRLLVWDSRGRSELDDVALFHKAIGYGSLFEKQPNKPDTPRLQPTWNKLIRILLSAAGRVSDNEDAAELTKLVREYQQTKLGRTQEESCLIELFPLPSQSSHAKDWIYGNYSSLDYCTNRKVYEEHFMSLRISHIKDLITQYKPPVVVFYSKKYLSCWEQIADMTFSDDASLDISMVQSKSTIFMIMKHPAYWTPGKTSAYFHNLGKNIASKRATINKNVSRETFLS